MAGHAPSGFFVLRTPRLPLAPIVDLRARAGDPEVRDAIAAASPGLAAAAAGGDGDLRIELSLTRYLARMSGRSTPRGLLSAISTGRLGGPARLRLGDVRPVSRVSAAAAMRIAARLEADPRFRPRIPYRPNPWLYEAATGSLRYVEPRRDGGHALVAAGAAEEVLATLERGRGGSTLPQLAAALVEGGVDPGDARAFVEELADAHLLLSDLLAPACGAEPAEHLLERVQALAPGSPQVRDLEELRDVAAAADRAEPGTRSATLARASGAAARLGLEGPPEALVQVDLMREAPGLALPQGVADTLLCGLDALRRILRIEEPEELARFRDAFRSRYGQRRVALCEALDPEAGIGFGREAATPAPASAGMPWGAAEQLMLRLVTEAAAGGLREVDISSALPSLSQRPPGALPDSLAILATVAADSAESVTAGDYEVRLVGAFGPSGARLFGRFCHHDPELRRLAEEHLRAEEALHPDAIFAEVAHFPDAQAGDVVSRPAMRRHEIALLAGAGGADGRLEPAELDVGLEADELVLRTRAGRRVIPRLTNAHNMFADGLGLYRFLALLQFQGTSAGLSWRWGPLEGAPFLPRVRVGRVVLAPARWRIAPEELRRLREGNHRRRAQAVAAWRRRVGCPRFAGLPVEESALPLDLDDPVCAEILLRDAPADGHAVVEEWWPEPERSPVLGPEGRYAHELLIPFVATRTPTRDRVAPRPVVPAAARARPPGSEWLFAKLYTAPALADDLIVHELAPLAQRAVEAGAAEGWHFLRYADPEFHLRLRLSGRRAVLRGHVLPSVLDAGERLTAAGAVRRVVLDTYEPETERYGGPEGLALAERVFHADSAAVAALLTMMPRGEEASRERWQLAAAGVWSLFGALGLQEDEALDVVRRLRDLLAAEQRLDRAGVRALARRLRTARTPIEALMDGPPTALRERDALIAPIGRAYAEADAAERLWVGRSQIAGDLAHMHCNRLLRASSPSQELAIHDALARIATGRAARARREAAVR